MIKGYNTFRQYVDFVESATINTPGMPGSNPDEESDKELIKKPQLMYPPNVNPMIVKPVIDAALQKKRMDPKAPLKAAIAGALRAKQITRN